MLQQNKFLVLTVLNFFFIFIKKKYLIIYNKKW